MESIERNKIIDTALELAAQQSWEAVRLYAIASATGISLNKERLYFREKEELVDAWFDRADNAMLKEAEASDFQALSSRQRVHRLIMTWLTTLAPYRIVTRQMIYGKMELGHLHVQIPGLLRVSRTVQWIREAANFDATHVRRALEESGLTTIYLITFFCWMKDNTTNSERTSCLLDGLLGTTEKIDQLFCGSVCSSAAKETFSTTSTKPIKSTQPKKSTKKQKLP